MLPIRPRVSVLLAALAGVAYVLIKKRFSQSLQVSSAIMGTVAVLITCGMETLGTDFYGTQS